MKTFTKTNAQILASIIFFEKKHEKTRACPDIHKRIRYIYAVFNKERIEIQYWSKFSAPVSG